MKPEPPAPTTQREPEGVTRCPLCAKPNQCGMAAGSNHCWCYNVDVPQSVIDRIPELFRGVVCVCQDCIRQAQVSSDAPEG